MNTAIRFFIFALLISVMPATVLAQNQNDVNKMTGVVMIREKASPPGETAEKDKKAKASSPPTVFYIKSFNGEVRRFDTAITTKAPAPAQAPAAGQPVAPAPAPQDAPPSTSPPPAPQVEQVVEVSYRLVEPDNHPALTEPVKVVGASVKGTVQEIAPDQTFIVVRTKNTDDPKRDSNISLQTDVKLQALVKSMRPGDGINSAYVIAGGINSAQYVEWQSQPVELKFRWLALVAGAILLYLLAYLFTRNPGQLIIGEDNRYSTSKFQTVMWFWLVISAYIAIVAHRIFASNWTYIGGVDIPLNLLALSGLNVFTFTAAKVITIGKIDQAAEKGVSAKPKAERPKFGDLIRSDEGKVDLGDFQMLVITILAIVVYAAGVVEYMETIEFRREVTMPDVDATLLAIFGLGQLAYLGKKVAGEGLAPAALEEVTKTVASATANAKSEAAKADKAAQDAETRTAEAATASEAARKAATRAGAEPEAKKAAVAARLADDAARQAAAAAQAAATSASDARKTLEGWARHPDIAALSRSATDAQGDTTKAEAAARKAGDLAKTAQASASAARTAADSHPA